MKTIASILYRWNVLRGTSEHWNATLGDGEQRVYFHFIKGEVR